MEAGRLESWNEPKAIGGEAMDAIEQQRKQLIDDIQTLPADVLQEVSALIESLQQKKALLESSPSSKENTKSTYEVLKESGLIGCMDGPPDLSVNYKKYLAEGLKEKYSHH